MSEDKVTRRGWVKNAAIIFLAIMLVLTFFSNTIMNHSLPEVAVQYVQSGSITAMIRGTGTVEATEHYEVTLDQTREVASVAVKTGDQVEYGAVLFTLSDGESDELQAAKDALYDLQIAYEKAKITATAPDYAEENREISKTQVKLSEAMNRHALNYVSDEEIKDAEKQIQRRQEDVDEINDELSLFDSAADPDGYMSLKEDLRDAERDLTEAQNELTELKAKQEEAKAAEEEMKQLQETLDNLQFGLTQKQNEQAQNQQISDLDLAAMRQEIASQQRKVDELAKDTIATEITAPISGVVTAVNISAGHSVNPDEALVVIEVPDMGYRLTFPVTNDQARKVKVGDQASISNYYYGGDITATLTGMKTDPEKPGQGKLLVFSLTGEVESGTQLSLSIGEKSANYDMIIPNSALRTDSKGDFVLVVTSKSSPLGTRYKAERVDVTVLAKDDNNAAISGSLTNQDYVITTSNRPVDNGQMVRLAE